MATRQTTVLVDDLDPHDTEDVQTITITTPDGQTLTGEFSRTHRDEISRIGRVYDDAMEPYFGAMRPATAVKAKARTTKKSGDGGQAAAIREWARSRGIEVPERGRLSQQVKDAYAAAHDGRAA